MPAENLQGTSSLLACEAANL